ncbi:MAG: serine/threonine protein kinase [Deltaproteobacteria bacterium]|nr:MAG: serine/threonine protein kinase [Deltaproteobacteria bacterium]
MDSQLYEQQLQQEGLPFGRYRLVAKLAVGGMAELFLARQKGVGGFSKTVVIKCVLPYLAQDQDFIAMFLSEARLAAHLNHPNVVQIFDIGSIDGIYYMAMEYIPGQNLREITRKMYRELGDDNPPPYNQLAAIFAQAAAGLEYVHNAKDDNNLPLHLVHRDISPNNIIVSYDGQVKIVDFGVAKARNQERQTEVGVLKGRLSYMSPEQVSGWDLDGRSDIYSLGIVLYELTTNRRLFRRKSEPETIQALLHGPVPSPTHFYPDYPPELEAILMKMLERSPDARYQSAAEVQQDLLQFLASQQTFMGPQDISVMLNELFAEEKDKAESGTFEQPISTQDLINLSRGSYRVIQDASLPHAYSGHISLPPGYVAATPTHAWPAGTGAFHPGSPSPPGPIPLPPNASVVTGPQQPAITAPYAPPQGHPGPSPFYAEDEPTVAGSLPPEVAASVPPPLPGVSPNISVPAVAEPEDPSVQEQPAEPSAPSVPPPVSVVTEYASLDADEPVGSNGKGWVWLLVVLVLIGGLGGALAMGWIQVKVGTTPPASNSSAEKQSNANHTTEQAGSLGKSKLAVANPRVVPSREVNDPNPPKQRGVDERVVPAVRRVEPPVERRTVVARKVPPRLRAKRVVLRKRRRRRALRRKKVARKNRRIHRVKGKVIPFAKARLSRRTKVAVFRRGDNGREFSNALPRLCRKIERETARLLGGQYRIRGITKPWQAYVKKRFGRGRRYKYVFYPRAAAFVIYSQSLKGKSFHHIAKLLVRYQRNYGFRRYSNL